MSLKFRVNPKKIYTKKMLEKATCRMQAVLPFGVRAAVESARRNKFLL